MREIENIHKYIFDSFRKVAIFLFSFMTIYIPIAVIKGGFTNNWNIKLTAIICFFSAIFSFFSGKLKINFYTKTVILSFVNLLGLVFAFLLFYKFSIFMFLLYILVFIPSVLLTSKSHYFLYIIGASAPALFIISTSGTQYRINDGSFLPLPEAYFYSKITVASIVFFAILTSYFVRKALILIFSNLSSSLNQSDLMLEEQRNISSKLTETNEELDKSIKELRDKEKYIQFLADYDNLTGLLVRRKLLETLDTYLNTNNSGSLLLIDIDNFKTINNTLGHNFGDQVLIHFSKNLKDITESKQIKAYRLGSDEFVILIKSYDFVDLVQELITKTNEKFEILGISTQISISCGIVKFPLDGTESESLMLKGDIALHSAKNSGKNRYAIYSEEMSASFEEKTNIERLIRESLINDKFYIVYQPLVNRITGEVFSFEALVRIKETNISPAKFIHIAEETGLIIPLGKKIISLVFAQLKEWQDKGLTLKPVAINLSVVQIYDENLLDFIKKQLEIFQITPNLIEFEITESIFIDNKDGVIDILNTFKDLGFSLALDDFGTGYSSLNYLTYIPINKVKLDKSLKDKFLTNNPDVLHDLITLIHKLHMNTVIEGVETLEEVSILNKGSCNLYQGYYFSKPVQSSEVPNLLNKIYKI